MVPKVGADLAVGTSFQLAQTIFQLRHHLGLGLVAPALHVQPGLLEGLAHPRSQGLLHEGQDGIHGLVGTPIPVAFEGIDGPRQPLLPALIDALEGLEQLDALAIGGAVGVEFAHRIEALAQGILPLGQVAGLLGQIIEDGHARPRGEPHQFDLDAVLFLDALGAVHHQDHARPHGHRLQEGAIMGEEGVVAMGLDELPGQVANLRMGLEPLQNRPRILESGGVDELDDRLAVDDDRIKVRFRGRARALVDGDAVILGQGGHHRGFTRIGVAHDRQPGDLAPGVRH